MTLEEIKEATNDGVTVYWKSDIYKVIKDKNKEYLVVCTLNDNVIGLQNKKTGELIGSKQDFYIKYQ